MPWTTTNTAKGDNKLYSDARGVVPSLDLRFASQKNLNDYMTGQQLIQFSRPVGANQSPGTYVDENGIIQLSSADQPRFDHDPTTGESLGLLVEEARTNYLLNSDSNNPSKWNAYPGVTITTSTTTAPDGSSNAIRIQATTSGQYAERTWAAPTTNTYAGSIYIRSRTGTDQNVRINFSGAGTTVQTVPASGDWVRLRDTHGSTVNAGGRYLYIQSLIGETLDVDVWGEQIELGSFPTSYIPTTGTALTRSADVASITGSNFSSWYNQSEGTVFTQYIVANISTPYSLQFDDGTNVNRILSVYNSAAVEIRKDTIQQYFLNFGIPSRGDTKSIATAFTTNNANSAVDGTLYSLDTSVTMPTVNQFRNTGATIGTIARLTYFPERLPDATLQAITAP